MKKILSILITASIMFSALNIVSAENNIETNSIHELTDNIFIEGKLEDEARADVVTVLMLKDKELKYIKEFPLNDDGSYQCKFKFIPDDGTTIADYSLKVNAGGIDVTDTVVTVTDGELYEFDVEYGNAFGDPIIDFTGDVKATVNIKNKYADKIDIGLYFANFNDGRFQSLLAEKTKLGYGVNNKITLKKTLSAEIDESKLLIWDGFRNMKPFAKAEALQKSAGNVSEFTFAQIENSVVLNAEVTECGAENVIFTLTEYEGEEKVNEESVNISVEKGKAKTKMVLEGISEGNTVKANIFADGLGDVSIGKGYCDYLIVKSIEELYGTVSDFVSVADITDFYNNKRAAVSITFDDAIYSAAEFYNGFFEEFNLHGTAMLVADWVKDEEISKWQSLFDKGYIDVGNHSKTHSIRYATDNPSEEELEEDITGGYEMIKQMFPGEQILTFAAPWTQVSSASLAEIKKNHYANRNGGAGFVSPDPDENTWYHLPAYVVLHTDTADKLNGKIDTAINEGKWFINLMHGIGEGTYNIDEDVCKEHFEYIGLRSNDIWSGSLNEVTKYILEKQNATVSVNWLRENGISLSVIDSLDDELFDFPLTIKVNVPSEWKKVVVYQDGKIDFADVILEESSSYAYINIIPDSGEVLVKCI